MSGPVVWNPPHPEWHQHEPKPRPDICPSCRLAGQMALLAAFCFLIAGAGFIALIWFAWVALT